jgi:uncharacterized protein (TIGR00730 family)
MDNGALRAVAIYCGSSPGLLPEYAHAATELGHEMASRGLTLVYGGASVGLMGQVANAAIAAGGHAVGVIPGFFHDKGLSHTKLDELHVVESMHQRKTLMAELADAFIALPGGMGTLEELFEAITWTQIGLHRKPCGLLNVVGYYDKLLAFLDHVVDQRLMKAIHRDLLQVAEEPAALLDKLAHVELPTASKWLDRKSEEKPHE